MQPKKKPSSDQISKVMAFLGSKGGKAGTGKAKSRDPKKMSAAAKKRWAQKKS